MTATDISPDSLGHCARMRNAIILPHVRLYSGDWLEPLRPLPDRLCQQSAAYRFRAIPI